jgi:signal transduction histidine kinase
LGILPPSLLCCAAKKVRVFERDLRFRQARFTKFGGVFVILNVVKDLVSSEAFARGQDPSLRSG